MADDIRPLLTNARDRRERIHQRTLEGIQDIFPIISPNGSLEIKDLKINPKVYSSNQQKEAIMRGRTLHEPVTATLVLRDKEGNKIEEKKNHNLLHLPYFTERHTFIVGGNEYVVPSQLRLKPGVYTRKRNNGEYEASFNLSKGSNFRLAMEPSTGKLNMELGSAKLPLYGVLRTMGVPDVDIKEHWGDALLGVNRSATKGNREAQVNRILAKVKRRKDPTPLTVEAKEQYVRDYFDSTAMDANVNDRTLGKPVSSANATALLAASKKLIKVHRGEATTDDRDSLEYKTIHSVDDFFKERLGVDAKRSIGRKLAMKVSQRKGRPLDKIIPTSTFTKSINGFLTSSNLSSIPMQINPMEIVDQATRVTSLGEGGITSDRAIPLESRKVHNTHLGILDSVRTPESFHVGVDIRSSLSGFRDDRGDMYAMMKNLRTRKTEPVSVKTLARSTVAFPGQEHRTHWDAIQGDDIVSVAKKDVDYALPDPIFMYGPSTSLVPLLDGIQGNRAIMGSKFQTQALPLLAREAPFVQTQAPRKKETVERELARMVVPTAPVAGTVAKIDADFVYLRPDGPKTAAPDLLKVPYDTYFPLASKTYLHNEVKVKVGDHVKAEQPLADSNFLKNDTMALGKNLSVGYLAYYGKNSNDAVVISSSAAQKLTSGHMYKKSIQRGNDIVIDKKKYLAYYGMQYSAAQLANLDDKGIAKAGVTLQMGDPVILGLVKAAPSPEALLLGNLHKSLVKPYRDITVTWEKPVPATVQDVMDSARQVMVTVRTEEPMKIGDKLANRFGGKGVVSEIIPDNRMIQREDGNPVDVLFTSASVVSRINPAQIVEASLGKVARKTGKPIVIPQFQRENNVEFARNLLKKHGLKDKETVFDPVSGRKIPNIFVGDSYIHKLFKSTETNYAARGVAGYDINKQPTRGGSTGAKGVGRMEVNTLLAHNARNVLRENFTHKSDKSDEFWRNYEFGLPPTPTKAPFASQKFFSLLRGTGINVDKKGSLLTLSPMSDKDVLKKSSGALKVPSLDKSQSFMVNAKSMKPERGGLFDPALTGGLDGTRWSHMTLAEPVVNPIFHEPVRRLLGYTKPQLQDALATQGGAKIKQNLNKINLEAEEKTLLAHTHTARGSDLDHTVKRLKYIRALRASGFKKAGDAYVLNHLPVVPPVLRPILPSQRGNELQVADLNYLYRDVGLSSQALNGIKETGLPDATEAARKHLNDATSALFGLTRPTSPQLQGREAKGIVEQITGSGSPKSGFLHKKVLRRRLDLSGRATATPDVTLDIDQIGLPEDMLWDTYEKFLMKGLIGQGHKPMDAVKMIEERHPAAEAVLTHEIKNRPVFVNRAPSLHRYNFVAAYPVAVPGKSLRVNPFMERGQNLDYDGDTMQIHVPVSDKAVGEAQKLTLSHLLFSDKNKDDLMLFPQHEAILGTYMATAKVSKGPTQVFATKAKAMDAYHKGSITMTTPIQIKA